jgi:Domain of unknown function (DUF5076)
MFNHIGELKIPPVAKADKDAKEIIRIWSSGETQQIIIRHDILEDAAAWGLCLVDVARHVSRAFAEKGHDEKEVFDRILWGFRVETENPTDEPTGEIEK